MKYGWHATFMPKPLFGENGSGMHTHQSLFSGRQERVLRPGRPVLPLGRRQGVHRGPAQARARDLLDLRAVGQLLQAPRAGLRGAGVRGVVAAQPLGAGARAAVSPGPEKATRMELRCPDPACNPYLTFAALLQAGLEGIEKGYELPEPMEKNLYHLSGEERRRLGIEQLPESLGEAIELTARVGARAAHARRAHVQPLRRDQAPGVGRLPRAGDAVGARPLPVDPLARSVSAPGDRRRRSGARGRGASACACSTWPNAVGWRGGDLGSRRSARAPWRSYSLLAGQLRRGAAARRRRSRSRRGSACPRGPCGARSALRRRRRSRRSRRARGRRSAR